MFELKVLHNCFIPDHKDDFTWFQTYTPSLKTLALKEAYSFLQGASNDILWTKADLEKLHSAGKNSSAMEIYYAK